MPFNTISVIGLGYIGLPTAAMFASKEKQVIGVDVNQHAVDTINEGKIHIVEPELEAMVKNAVDGGFLKAKISPESADAFLIAVPTPFISGKTEGSAPQPDLSFIEAAAKSVAIVLKKGDLVILESTSPVGATEQMTAWLADARPDLTFPQTHGENSDIRVAHCPERVLPGHVVRELVENDRIIGGMTHKCSAAAIELYKIFVNGECSVTNARTAEMAKLTENASRDVSIAFANELSIICDNLGIDVWELIGLANLHPRVNILQPGPGVGGHCIAVDPWFIVAASPEDSKLIKTSREINDSKPDWVVSKVKLAIERCLGRNSGVRPQDLKIACYGLAFKADIDDLRESPAVSIVKKIIGINRGQTLLVEPNILKIPKELSGGELVNFRDALLLADIHLLLVDHSSFKSDRPSVGEIIDTRGIWTSSNNIG
jgi:UDP-N-acetyl-D-mannosaminuronic acid dehydrogenase